MLRPRPEPSDLAASLVPRMGDTPFAPPRGDALRRRALRGGMAPTLTGRFTLPREAADAAEQQAIADAVEGVIP